MYLEIFDTPFEGISNGSVAFSDVDKDFDKDLFISGINASGTRIGKLYINNGTGIFTESENSVVEAVSESAVAFRDLNGDGDSDLFITGSNNSAEPIVKLYLNDGSGVLAESIISPFTNISTGEVAFSDVNGDGATDVLISGLAQSSLVTELYINDGFGNYSEVLGTPFVGCGFGAAGFADVDNDNDQDVLITGSLGGFSSIAKLYLNDGTGKFTEDINTPFSAVDFSAVAFADIDGDNDQDVLISGRMDSMTYVTKLYLNNGLGSFSEVENTPFEGVNRGALAFADVDGDNDQDVLITGFTNTFDVITKMYINDGLGTYTETENTIFEGSEFGDAAFADIDGDNDQDLLITGKNNFYDAKSRLYLNDGSGIFSLSPNNIFEDVHNGSIAFSDVDEDNDQDVLITGENDEENIITKLYKNDGTGLYSEVLGLPFEGIRNSAVAFEDIDGDGDQDVLLAGSKDLIFDMSTKLYINEGTLSSIKPLKIKKGFDFKLFPNPISNRQLNVLLLSVHNYRISTNIFDLNGRLLISHTDEIGIGATNFTIDISNLPKGSYMIQVDDGTKMGTQQFVIQ